MSRWFRLYECTLDDPKVQRLPGDRFKFWINLLCLASRNDGALPPVEDIAFTMRVKKGEAEIHLSALKTVGLIDVSETGMSPHNWSGRQFQSDVSTQRVKRFRERSRNAKETLPDTETEQNRVCASREADLRQGIVKAFAAGGSPNIPDTSRVAIWIERGWKSEICLAVIGECLARKPSISSLSYFERAIADAHIAPIGQARPPPRQRPADQPSALFRASESLRHEFASNRNGKPDTSPAPAARFDGPVIDAECA